MHLLNAVWLIIKNMMFVILANRLLYMYSQITVLIISA